MQIRAIDKDGEYCAVPLAGDFSEILGVRGSKEQGACKGVPLPVPLFGTSGISSTLSGIWEGFGCRDMSNDGISRYLPGRYSTYLSAASEVHKRYINGT